MMDGAEELEDDASGVCAKIDKGRINVNNIRNL
jgi:hypothetical protein